MKIFGLLVIFLGLLIVVGFLLLTPTHSYNPADSTNGTNSSEVFVYSGFIVFGLGLAIYTSTLKFAGEKNS